MTKFNAALACAAAFSLMASAETYTYAPDPGWKDDTAPNGSWRVCQDASGSLHPVMQGTVICLH